MARPEVDYEAAWEELQELILGRDGWGTRSLITEMAHLRVKHKIQTEDPASTDGGMPTDPRAGHVTTDRSEEDHDGSRSSPPGPGRHRRERLAA